MSAATVEDPGRMELQPKEFILVGRLCVTSSSLDAGSVVFGLGQAISAVLWVCLTALSKYSILRSFITPDLGGKHSVQLLWWFEV